MLILRALRRMQTPALRNQLFVWSDKLNTLAYDSRCSLMSQLPRENIQKVIDGQNSRALITKQGNLLISGSNASSFILNSNQQYVQIPKYFSFFKDNNLTVKDLAFAKDHVIALTSQGNIFVWGNTFSLKQYLYTGISSLLGNGAEQSKNPSKVEIGSEIKSVAAGTRFSLALSKDNKLFRWGVHKHFSDPFPVIFENVMNVCEKAHSPIKRIEACNNFFVFQLQNGELYSYGNNIQGAMGNRINDKVRSQQFVQDVYKVNDRQFKGQKVVDWEIGANSLILLTDQGKVYFSGLQVAYYPIELQIPKGVKVNSIAAADNSVAAATDKGVFMGVGEFMQGKRYPCKDYFMYHNKQLWSKIGGRFSDRWGFK